MGVFAMATSVASADECTLLNPTRRDCPGALVRLKVAPPGMPGTFVVREGGAEVPYQVEAVGGRPCIWVLADFPPNAAKVFTLEAGKPAPQRALAGVRRDGGFHVLESGGLAVRVPAEAVKAAPGPLAGIRMPDGRWVGTSAWVGAPPLSKFSAEVIAGGPLLARVRLRYDFDARVGLDGTTPAFSEVEFTVGAGREHVEVAERHAMRRRDAWELAISDGWRPTEGRSVPFSAGPGSGTVTSLPEPNRPLRPGALPFCPPELFINLFPRWNQHYKDGWFFAASDGASAVGLSVVKASRWVWPHDNSLRAVVRDSGDYAGVRCPTWHGQRVWWLQAGPVETAGTGRIAYLMRHAFEDLDKLNHEFVLEWPGRKGSFQGMDPYNGGQVNPTGSIRREGRTAAENAGKPGDIGTLTRAQVRFHGDTYGSYWNYWSPENPNFFTDFMRIPIALVTTLKEHPAFDRFRAMAIAAMQEDLYHSVTLPGGAGQECPGYMFRGQWSRYVDLAREHFGADVPVVRERVEAAERFVRRISQPDGAVRRFLPMGDTHPGPDGPNPVQVPPAEVAAFRTEELPGFGVVFNHRPGTPDETYLAMKSGPNRGHYHGDQLAIHYGAGARPVAVDHHCSYSPRAGQEHMHNRLAFFTDDEPYLNMDGYERLIAFKTSDEADVAIGQVESARLRRMAALPPEYWHQEWPMVPLAAPLVYRRTAVFVKSPSRAYLVLRDQYRAPVDLGVAFCLHVLDPETVAVAVQEEGKGGETDGSAAFADADQDFGRLGAGPGWVLDVGAIRKGKASRAEPLAERYAVRSAKGSRLVLDRPAPPGRQQAYVLFRPTYREAGRSVAVGRLALFVAAPDKPSLRFFPWYHLNGGPEMTQGIRLETRGRQGEYVAVISSGPMPAMKAVPGGVQVGDDEIRFAGAIGEDPETAYVTVQRGGKVIQSVTGRDIDLERSQGDIGLFVPDAGYPFGDIPDWLLRQRTKRPDWAR
jgi:hypothetical protein